MFDFQELDQEEGRVYKPIVLHQDADEGACQATSRSIELLCQGASELAKAVTFFGPGIVVLPMFGRISNVKDERALTYEAHPKRATQDGLVDRTDLQSRFGRIDPQRLIEELSGGGQWLEDRLKVVSDEDLQDEVEGLQDWKAKAQGRLKMLEKRAAWAFLGIPVGMADQASIKRAFKRKALELHPDKGGDPCRFQLLQEMKGLLILPSNTDAESNVATDQPRTQNNDKAKKEEDSGEDDSVDGFSSDSSYDADEEFKKMFPKKKKKKRVDDEEADLNLKSEKFSREKHEAARRKLHRTMVETWERTGQLQQEISLSEQKDGSTDALRQLRKFVDRFASSEVRKLTENDSQKAQRILRRFLEQGAEVLCAAGCQDVVATVSIVVMQINVPLITMVPTEDMKRRCNALIEAVQLLPSTLDVHLGPVDRLLCSRKLAERKSAEAAVSGPVHVRLVLPDFAGVKLGSESPNIRSAEIDLRPACAVKDLRAAAVRLFGCVLPVRLFCGSKFLGDDTEFLANIGEIMKGDAVQVLLSNKPGKTEGARKEISEAAEPLSTKTSRALSGDPAQPESCQSPPAWSAQPVRDVPRSRASEASDNDADDWFDDFFSSKADMDTNQGHRKDKPLRNGLPDVREPSDVDGRLQRGAGEQAATQVQVQRSSAKTAPQACRDIALTEDKLVRLRVNWDSEWEHSCAGGRKDDGSAIFCCPCERWISTAEPFDHRGFDLHCETLGHYGWID